MKKIIYILLISLLAVSCNDKPKQSTNPNYSVVLEIHYPIRIDTITVEGESYEYPELYSSKGSNYVSNLYSTNAPIKIISITEIPK